MKAARLLRRRGGYHPVRTPSIIQMEPLECGPVALAIVLAYFGRWEPIEELRIACGVSRNGSRANHLLRAARSYGLTARAFKAEPAMLQKLQPPLVLHWNFTHFVVFEGFARGGRVRINDPGMGRRTITAAELDESMTGVVLAFEPGPSFERMGNPPRLWRALRIRLERAHGAMLFAVLISVLILIPSLLMPAFLRLFVDRVMLWRLDNWVAPMLAGMAGTLLLLSVLTWLQRAFLLRFETQLAVQGAGRLFWHLLRLPIEFFTQRFPGDISSRVALNDRLAQLFAGDLAVSALHVLVLAGFAAVMIQYDVLLTMLSLLLVAVNLIVLCWASQKRADANMRLLREEGRLNGVALWGLEMIESLKATSSEGDLFAKWAGQQAKVLNLRRELELANQPLEMLPALLTALNAALILGLGGLRVIDGQLSLGSLVSFQVLAATFTGPVNRLVSLARRLQIAEGEMGLLDDVFRTAPIPLQPPSEDSLSDEQAPERLAGSLSVQAVTFGYSPIDPPVIRDVDLCLEPGAYVAVVGKTSSGKSSLIRLILGLHEPWQGEVLFDGTPRRELRGSIWFDSVAAVDQDVMVFEGSVRDNLTVFKGEAPEAQLVAAARDACILDDIMARPGGLDTWISEGGTNWSGGQLQRLEIARALVGAPSLLVLDEATSALDPETEARIIGNLRRRGCSCLVVAHRLSTIRDADEIVVLEEGRVAERGTHDDLMCAGGLYSQLVIHE